MLAKTYDMSTSFAETFKNQMVIFISYSGKYHITIRLITTVLVTKTKSRFL